MRLAKSNELGLKSQSLENSQIHTVGKKKKKEIFRVCRVKLNTSFLNTPAKLKPQQNSFISYNMNMRIIQYQHKRNSVMLKDLGLEKNPFPVIVSQLYVKSLHRFLAIFPSNPVLMFSEADS